MGESTHQPPAAGSSFGPYLLEEVLGEGGAGVVYRAIRETDETVWAVKLLKQELAGDPDQVRRFSHEVRAASQVNHRHLVRIVDSGEIEGVHYLVEGFLPGPTLKQRIQVRGPLEPEELCRVVADVASGLDALHGRDLVHRDIKSSNVIFDAEGGAVLTDFGLSRGSDYTVLTLPGHLVGTLDYLAPEIIRGEPATSATDIYALGCLAHEAICGTPPFADRSVFQIGLAHLEDEPPDPLAHRRDLPATVTWAVRSALAKDPADRPSTATMYARMVAVAVKGRDR